MSRVSSAGLTNSSRNSSPEGMTVNMPRWAGDDLFARVMSIDERVAILVADVCVEELALGVRAPHGVVGLDRDLVIAIATPGHEHEVEMLFNRVVLVMTDDARGHDRATL